MKQEVKDIALQVAVSSPTSMWALFTKITIAEWVAIVFGILQAAYLIRKWVREESEWVIKSRRWARGQISKWGPL